MKCRKVSWTLLKYQLYQWASSGKAYRYFEDYVKVVEAITPKVSTVQVDIMIWMN